jgi:hypothetical protein
MWGCDPARRRIVGVVHAPSAVARWLGWMVRRDDMHWTFRMEAVRIDMLNAIPKLCESR